MTKMIINCEKTTTQQKLNKSASQCQIEQLRISTTTTMKQLKQKNKTIFTAMYQ